MRRHFYAKAVLVLAAIGLLFAGTRGAFRAGWWQGYQMGQADESGEERAMPYWGPYGGGFRGMRGYHPFGFARGLLTVMMPLLLLGLFAKLLGFWAWRTMSGSAGKAGHKGWPHGPWTFGCASRHPWAHGHKPHAHRPHGPMPPWCWGHEGAAEEQPDKDEPTTEQVAKVKPDAQATEGEG